MLGRRNDGREVGVGLLFVMPGGKGEGGYVEETSKGLVLRSYGLPFVFWGYLGASFVTLFFLFLAVWSPMTKMMDSHELMDIVLSYSVFLLFCFIPLGLLSFYCYEKCIIKKGERLSIIHKVFGLALKQRAYVLWGGGNPFIIRHYLDSPNVAKMEGDRSLRAFHNQGYFILSFRDEGGQEIFLDRHSRKADLEKLVALLG